MKHTFEIGENIFCFEPDETKEKLIYQARIITHCGYGSVHKKSVPLYTVHFLGWNKKWDRIVSQDLLLPLNDFNMCLKAKIEQIAKDEEKNHSLRHDLIDGVLDIASKVSNEGAFDWDTVDEKLMKYRHDCKQSKKAESSINDSKSIIDHDTWNEQTLEKPLSENFDAISDCGKSLYTRENDLIHLTFCPKINLTDNQMAILELDHKLSRTPFFSLKNIGDIDKYAHRTCVIDILQTYLDVVPHCDFRVPGWKDFERFCDMDTDCAVDSVTETSAFNFFDPVNDPGTRRPMKLPLWPDSELNASYQKADVSTQLCFEVCSGLRVMFDFYSRSCLLYEHEWANHDAMVALCDAHSQNQMLKPLTSEFSVKLVPDPFRNHRFGFQPSLFYGYPHLLRMLHEMPRILVRLSLTRASLAVVLRHCYSLIRYLDLHYREYSVAETDQCLVPWLAAVSKPQLTRKRPLLPKKRSSLSEGEVSRRSLRSDGLKVVSCDIKRRATVHVGPKRP